MTPPDPPYIWKIPYVFCRYFLKASLINNWNWDNSWIWVIVRSQNNFPRNWNETRVGKETHRWPIINGSAMVLIILRDNLCLFVHFIKEVWLVKQEWIYFTWMFWRFSSFTAQFWFEYIFAPLIIFTAKIFYFGLKFYDFMILSFFPI